MASSDVIQMLPVDGDYSKWTPSERALVEASGLVRVDSRSKKKELADRATVEAFLAHCRRTQLDPIARQIYAIYRGGKWQIQLSIDGARLVAERTNDYEGQTTPEFTSDGVTWTQVWLSNEPPKAARVGVYRRGFREALVAIALWDAYAVMQDEYSNGSKTGKKTVSAMWAKMGPLMLAKCAEMLALRKAFPQDLSGLYSSEEMAQAGGTTPAVEAAPGQRELASPKEEPIVVRGIISRDWAALAEACTDMDTLRALHREADQAGEMGLIMADDRPVGAVFHARKAILLEKPVAPEPETKPVVLDIPAETGETPNLSVPEDDGRDEDAIADAAARDFEDSRAAVLANDEPWVN